MALSPEVAAIIQEAVRIGGDQLKGKLPPIPWLPKRNPYAHLYERIKAKMGKSYKECDDEDAERIMELIEYYVRNPC
mgnify:FL=1|tara:strand:+ start:115 stop:345 length:231 start_codon:yes stop_codon:yes gene_type:complete